MWLDDSCSVLNRSHIHTCSYYSLEVGCFLSRHLSAVIPRVNNSHKVRLYWRLNFQSQVSILIVAVDNNTVVTQFTSRHLSLINTRTFSLSLLSTATEFVDRSKGKSVRRSCLIHLPFKRCLASLSLNRFFWLLKKCSLECDHFLLHLEPRLRLTNKSRLSTQFRIN